MPKIRASIPKAVSDAVLREFNHRCAICGEARPHLHHIDENPSNNPPENLIPLCPNCHLTDQHDATNAVPKVKLAFFRIYKHRNILKPQFKSIFSRMAFLNEIHDDANALKLSEAADELIRFVEHVPMGGFFAGSLKSHLALPLSGAVYVPGSRESEIMYEEAQRKRDSKYLEQLRRVRPDVERLIVELLDHQDWRAADDRRTS